MRERHGSLLVDALLAIVIFGAVVAAFSSGVMQGQFGTVKGNERIRAMHIAEEGLNAVRWIRDKANSGYNELFGPLGTAPLWTVIAPRTHGVRASGVVWTMQTDAPTIVDGVFTRKLKFTDAGDGARAVESIVTWQGNKGLNTVSLSTLLANWQTDPLPKPDWTKPSRIAALLHNDILEKIAIDGNRAYIVGSKPNQPGFYVYDISEANLLNPPLLWSVDITNGIEKTYDIVINDNYAYIATDKAGDEVLILDRTTPTPTIYHISLEGTSTANSLAVYSNILFIGKKANNGQFPEFFAYNIRSDLDSDNDEKSNAIDPILLGSYDGDDDLDISLNINGISIVPITSISPPKTYAFLACEDADDVNNDIEVLALDVTDPTNISRVGDLDIITGTKNNAVIVSPSTPTDIFLGHAYGTYGLYSMRVSYPLNPLDLFPPPPLLSTPPNTNGQLDFVGGTEMYKAAYDFAMSTTGTGFVATDMQRTDPDTGLLHQFPFIIMDFSNATDMDGDQIIYRGETIYSHILDNDMEVNEGGSGIAFRETDNTVFLVTTDGVSKSHFAIIRPSYKF